MPKRTLENKVAIIIGAGQQPGQTQGNGRAVALQFAAAGARLVLVDVQPDWLQSTLQAVLAEGAEAVSLLADITQEADCQNIAHYAYEQFGRIDILYNNVGKSAGDGASVGLSLERWESIFDLNLKGTFMTCKHVLPYMIKQGSGCIINTSSTASIAKRPNTAYKVSKAAVNALTQHLAMENAEYGIRVNAILPGLIDTPMAIERRAKERQVSRDIIRAERNAQVPLGLMGTAQDVAHAALFLASDQASYITGVLLPVDGGLLCKIG